MKAFRAYTRPKIRTGWLLAAMVIALGGFATAHLGGAVEKNPWYDRQLAAARRMQASEQVLYDFITQSGIPIEQEDINRTGLIGPEMTVLTTSMGLLEAKRTSLNPDLAALMVTLYRQAGLEAGDQVALGISGSFPGLAIAALSAATEMGLEARCIVSYGASTFGATRPELTVPRMLHILRAEGLVEYQLLAVSPGGDDDAGGGGLYENTRQVILALAQQENVPIILEEDLGRSIQHRLALYGDGVRCFINVGGASANMGDGMHSLDFPPGLVLNPPPIPDSPTRGLIYEYAVRGVPVIHLLNLRKLSLDHGLPFDPVPLPEPGGAAVYYRKARQPALLIGAMLLAIAVLYLGYREDKARLRVTAPGDAVPIELP